MDFVLEGLPEGDTSMSIGCDPMDNDLFYVPEEGFWAGIDKLSFEAARIEAEWPEPSNPFIRRMASELKSSRGFHNVNLDDFIQMVGWLVTDGSDLVYRFILVPMGPTGTKFSVRLIEANSSLPPLRSDNICSIRIATSWMAERYDHFELSCSVGGSYWVHKR